jgi:hypothetical protein
MRLGPAIIIPNTMAADAATKEIRRAVPVINRTVRQTARQTNSDTSYR